MLSQKSARVSVIMGTVLISAGVSGLPHIVSTSSFSRTSLFMALFDLF